MKNVKVSKGMVVAATALMVFVSPVTAVVTQAKKADKTPPKITNVKVSNITADGYEVTCNVTDNVGVTKVYVPSWTSHNDQDDIIWHEATIKGKKASCYIKTSSHNGESGIYYSHVYAYDKAGNAMGDSSLGKINVPQQAVDFSKAQKKYPNYSCWNSSYKNKAWQCHGWALTVGDMITGKDPTSWKKVYNLKSLKAGDIVRCGRPHTIIITGVSGDTITYADCNWVKTNTVKWGQTIKRNKITSKFGRLQYVLVRP